MSKRTIIIILGGIALLLLLLVSGVVVVDMLVKGSKDTSSNSSVQRVELPGELTILYTCDTRGHIEPCGCSSGMAGGISRRLNYLAASRPAHSLLVDVGDVVAGPRDWERLEFEYLLRGYSMMNYDAVNLGHREAMLTSDQLREFKNKYDRFVSANLATESGELIFDPYRIVEITPGAPVGIIGVMGAGIQESEIGKGLRIIPPAEAIARWLPEIKSKTDFIVLLAFCTEEEIRALADQFFEINVIVGGKILQPTGDPLAYNKSTVVLITDKGKGIGRLELSRNESNSWTSKNDIVRLEETMPTDDRMTGLIDDYKALLKEMDIEPHREEEDEGLTSIASARSATADRYVGEKSCTECHPKAVEAWSQSKHAHAYQTLQSKDQQYNPRCLECHTVGYGASDGYTNERLTAHLQNVSCESCHGRGDLHAKAHASPESTASAPKMKTSSCTVCHDLDNSPSFQFDSYWAKIIHGKD